MDTTSAEVLDSSEISLKMRLLHSSATSTNLFTKYRPKESIVMLQTNHQKKNCSKEKTQETQTSTKLKLLPFCSQKRSEISQGSPAGEGRNMCSSLQMFRCHPDDGLVLATARWGRMSPNFLLLPALSFKKDTCPLDTFQNLSH